MAGNDTTLNATLPLDLRKVRFRVVQSSRAENDFLACFSSTSNKRPPWKPKNAISANPHPPLNQKKNLSVLA